MEKTARLFSKLFLYPCEMYTGLYLMINILSLVALDVSADLTELGRTPIAVVSAGVKSILDIGRTLEFLVRL